MTNSKTLLDAHRKIQAAVEAVERLDEDFAQENSEDLESLNDLAHTIKTLAGLQLVDECEDGDSTPSAPQPATVLFQGSPGQLASAAGAIMGLAQNVQAIAEGLEENEGPAQDLLGVVDLLHQSAERAMKQAGTLALLEITQKEDGQ